MDLTASHSEARPTKQHGTRVISSTYLMLSAWWGVAMKGLLLLHLVRV